jgi:pyrimidine operon attenuation protein/uracil phosphoribosyltransferase
MPKPHASFFSNIWTDYLTIMSSIDAEALYRAVLAQIRDAYGDALGGAVLAGIYSGGAWLAERLAHDLNITDYGVVNVALHRDDYAKKGLHSQASPTSLPFEVDNRRIVLVDDVLYTGRTVRAALNELYDYGRPASVELAVLADRGGRELPVAARFVGGVVEIAADTTLVLERQVADGAQRFTFHTEARAD